MPHYQDGTLAQLGDRVRGPVDYPTRQVVEGIVTHIVESDACNATIVYLDVRVLTAFLDGKLYQQNVNGQVFEDEDGKVKVVQANVASAVQLRFFNKVEV